MARRCAVVCVTVDAPVVIVAAIVEIVVESGRNLLDFRVGTRIVNPHSFLTRAPQNGPPSIGCSPTPGCGIRTEGRSGRSEISSIAQDSPPSDRIGESAVVVVRVNHPSDMNLTEIVDTLG